MNRSPGEIEELVLDKENNLTDLHKRMDDDFDLWNLKEVRYEGHKTGVNITSNRPRTFVNKVLSTLASAERQIIVRMAETEGEDKREEIAKLERLFQFALEKADERLRRLLFAPLLESLVWYSLLRGWVAARILVYKSKDSVVFDFLPLDPRWLTYEVGGDGLLWASYKTFRSRTSLIDEYDFDIGEKQSAAVLDYWEGKPGEISNAVVCNHEWLKEPETYKLSSLPILVASVGNSPSAIILPDGTIQILGESIFAPNRLAYGISNRLRSMWATQANLLAKQPTINYYKEGGKQLTSTVYLAEAVVNLPEGLNKLEESPMREISPTLVSMSASLDKDIEDGSLPVISLGPQFPSGTMLNLAQETGNVVFNPQIRLLNFFYADICRLIEEQLLSGGIGVRKINKVKVRTEEKRKYFETEVTPVDLKKPHIIKVEFTARTPWTQLDTYQIADMAKRLGLPDGFIQEYILKLPDPKGLGDQVAIEMAEHSPKLAMLRAIKAFIKQGRLEEAQQLMRDMYNQEMAEEQGGISGQETPTEEGTIPVSEGAPPPGGGI